MANMKNVRDGLDILLRYEPKGETAAEHDVLYACAPAVEVSEADAAELKRLGWLKSEEYESWMIFT